MHLVRTPLGGVLVLVRSLIRTPFGQRCPGVSEVCLPPSPYVLSLSLFLPPPSILSPPPSSPPPPSIFLSLPPFSPPPSPPSPYFLSLPPSLLSLHVHVLPLPLLHPLPLPLLSLPISYPSLSSILSPLSPPLPPSIFFQRCPGS